MPLTKCPNCGEFVSQHLNFCPQCGARLPEAAATANEDTATRLVGQDDTATRLVNNDATRLVRHDTAPIRDSQTEPRKRHTWAIIAAIFAVAAIAGVATLAFLGSDDATLSPTNAEAVTDAENMEPKSNEDEAVVTTETQTPDMAMHDVRGPVASVSLSDGSEAIHFDAYGHIINDDEGNGYTTTITRDDNGYITSITMTDGYNTYEEQFTWSEGRVTTRTGIADGTKAFTDDLQYDDQGRVSISTFHYFGRTTEYTVYLYEYTEADQYGNWTERSEDSSDFDDEGNELQSQTTTVRRHITYR